MAQKVNIILVDDIDGSDATETMTFGLDGATYEIDLNDKHAAQLRDALSGYLGHAPEKVADPLAALLGEGQLAPLVARIVDRGDLRPTSAGMWVVHTERERPRHSGFVRSRGVVDQGVVEVEDDGAQHR